MVQNYIMGSYYGIVLQNDIMELYYGIIFMKTIPGMPGTSQEPPGIPGIPWARPWEPGDAPGTPGTPLGPQARPWDPAGTSPWGSGTSLGPPGDPRGPLMDLKNVHISTNIPSQEALNCCVRTCLLDLVGTHRPNDSPGPFYI